jgi:dTDP-4-dehydrorhamnose reductase
MYATFEQHLLYNLLTCDDNCWDETLEIVALVHSKAELVASLNTLQQKSKHNVSVESLDLSDSLKVEAWFSLKPPFDACVHTAAWSSPKQCQDNPEQAYRINNPTTFFASLCPCAKLICISTDQAYLGDNAAAPYAETDIAQPVNVYGATKVAMETSALSCTATAVVLLRCSLILGPPAPLLEAHTTFLQFCASRQATAFYTNERRSAVFVNDVVACVVWFLTNTFTSDVYNLGGPASVSRHDMARAVYEYLQYDVNSLIAVEKAVAPDDVLPSPLDISMDIQKIQQTTGLKFSDLPAMLEATFPPTVP